MTVALTAAIAILAVVAGSIHLSLGGLLFTLNAVGYFALAAAYLVAAVVTHPIVVRFRWLPRIGLIGYAATTIVAWLIMGGRYDLGYLTKAIEVTLIVLVVVDIYRVYGGLPNFTRHAFDSIRWAVTWVGRRAHPAP